MLFNFTTANTVLTNKQKKELIKKSSRHTSYSNTKSSLSNKTMYSKENTLIYNFFQKVQHLLKTYYLAYYIFINFLKNMFLRFLLFLFIERQIKALKRIGPKTWCTQKPFGYRVAHHGYLLTPCPGLSLKSFSVNLR